MTIELFIAWSLNVPLAHPSYRPDTHTGWCPADLGPQPQLGLRTQWGHRLGDHHPDYFAANGANLKKPIKKSSEELVSTVQLLPDFFKPLDADGLRRAQLLGEKADTKLFQ